MRGLWFLATVLSLTACGSRPYERLGRDIGIFVPDAGRATENASGSVDAGRGIVAPLDGGASGAAGASPCGASDLDCLADALCPSITRNRCVELARAGGLDGHEEPHCFLRTCCGGRGVAVLAQAHGACTRDDDCLTVPITVDCGSRGRVDWCGPPIHRAERTAFDAERAAFERRACDLLPQTCPDVSATCESPTLRCVAGRCQQG